jgi:hypothetical protein
MEGWAGFGDGDGECFGKGVWDVMRGEGGLVMGIDGALRDGNGRN